MKFFIDTANINEIKEAASMGVLDGVTTNPSLLAREGKDPVETYKEICSIVDGPVSAEVISLDKDGMLKEAHELAKIHKNIVVKIPLTKDGMQAVKILSSEGIKTNVTLCFSATQALFAARAGASYISPFVGRLDDIATSGMELIGQIVQIYNNYAFDTEVLVASVRHPMHIVEAALMGADVAMLPFKVIEQLLKHPLTDKGIQNFLADYNKVYSK